MIKSIEEVSCAFLHDIDLVCFSHLRWGFVFQRPNHLLSRFSKHQRVFFIEEPIFYDGEDKLQIENYNENLFVVTPHMRGGISEEEVHNKQRKFINNLFTNHFYLARYWFKIHFVGFCVLVLLWLKFNLLAFQYLYSFSSACSIIPPQN